MLHMDKFDETMIELFGESHRGAFKGAKEWMTIKTTMKKIF